MLTNFFFFLSSPDFGWLRPFFKALFFLSEIKSIFSVAVKKMHYLQIVGNPSDDIVNYICNIQLVACHKHPLC